MRFRMTLDEQRMKVKLKWCLVYVTDISKMWCMIRTIFLVVLDVSLLLVCKVWMNYLEEDLRMDVVMSTSVFLLKVSHLLSWIWYIRLRNTIEIIRQRILLRGLVLYFLQWRILLQNLLRDCLVWLLVVNLWLILLLMKQYLHWEMKASYILLMYLQ